MNGPARIKLAAVGLVAGLGLLACGNGSGGSGGGSGGTGGAAGGAGGSGGEATPCASGGAGGGAVTEVDVALDSPLPAELGASCTEGDPTELEGILLLGEVACSGMTVSASGVTGCCPDVAADQNYSAVLSFRITGTFTLVGEQTKLLEVPSTSDSVVPLSFSGRPVENFATNRDDWCNGL